MTSPVLRRALPIGAALLALSPARSYAIDPEVTSDTVAQFYEVRSPTGETILDRRRLTSMLGLSVYDLLNTPPGNPKAADISLRFRLRYDADYGASSALTDTSNFNSIVPGFSNGLVDLMYGYIEGRRLAGGLLGFKLGRQYMTDVLGWWSFDGGEVSITTPYYVKAEVYGGFEQRGGMPLSTDRYESEGIWRGSRGNFDPSLYPSFQPTAVAPAIGAAIESTGVTWIHGRLSYRRVYNTGDSAVTQFASDVFQPAVYNGMRISQDRLGYAMDATIGKIGGLKAGVVYDFYQAQITSLYASLDAYLGNKVTASLDADYYVPWFDGDSIWNFFAGQPTTDFALRGNVDVNRHLSIAASGHVKFYTVQTEPFDPVMGASGLLPYMASPGSGAKAANGIYFPGNEHPTDQGGNIQARWHTGETKVTLRANGQFGDEGDRVGGDLSGEHVIESRYLVSGRAGVWQWQDNLRADRNAVGVNYVAALGYRFAPRDSAKVEFEHDINRLVGNRFRLMLWLNLAVSK